jgi:hypothetical protein
MESKAGATWAAIGQVRRALTTDAAGQLVDVEHGAPAPLPAGPYELTIIPSAATGSDGRKTVELQLDGDEHLDLKLSPKGAITGAVFTPAGERLRARVTARNLNEEFFADTDDEGHFSLSVDDGMTYSLVVRALSGDEAAAQVGPLWMANLQVTGETDLGMLTLPRAVKLSGRVVTKSGLAIAGALIRIWCSGSGCLTSELVDEGLSASDGSFTVRVPPP